MLFNVLLDMLDDKLLKETLEVERNPTRAINTPKYDALEETDLQNPQKEAAKVQEETDLQDLQEESHSSV